MYRKGALFKWLTVILLAVMLLQSAPTRLIVSAKTNHFTTSARKHAASVFRPILLTKPCKPERFARSLNFIVRKIAATVAASAPAISHPMIRITKKPMTRGIAPRNMLRAVPRDTVRASLHPLISIFPFLSPLLFMGRLVNDSNELVLLTCLSVESKVTCSLGAYNIFT